MLESWEDYDNKKKRKEDALYFSCTEDWEVNYLISKVINVFPRYTREQIKDSILQCCKTVKAPRPRKEFVACVLKKLTG